MSPQELADAFSKAGIDTVAKIDYFAKLTRFTAERAKKERELSTKVSELQEIIAPNKAEQLSIRNEIAEIDVEINALVSPK